MIYVINTGWFFIAAMSNFGAGLKYGLGGNIDSFSAAGLL
jgi:hypothetical protein